MDQLKELKGLEMLTAARVLNEDSKVQGSEQHPQYYEESSDNDFEIPHSRIHLNM